MCVCVCVCEFFSETLWDKFTHLGSSVASSEGDEQQSIDKAPFFS